MIADWRRLRRCPAPLAVGLLMALLMASCATMDSESGEGSPEAETAPATPNDAGDGAEGERPAEEAPDQETEPAPGPAEVDANELGQVPVLMYHRLLADGGSVYDLTPEQFRAELEYLHAHDYRPVRTDELIDGTFDVPAGTTPVVLTFDDSTREQFGYTDDGELDPDSAVGILTEFAEEHDDFDATGSFYVLGSLFGTSGDAGAEKLADLHERGFELGNHTLDHGNLGNLGAEEVQRELAEGKANITGAVPEAEVRSMALPLGVWPSERELARTGSDGDTDYAHEAVLLVGSAPSVSPFAEGFDPAGEGIPRIRSLPPESYDADDPEHTMTSGYWFERFEAHPEERYISDGDPETVSFPEELADQLDEAFTEEANPY